MLAGQAPFYDDNVINSYAKIQKGHISWKRVYHIKKDAQDIISQLLKVDLSSSTLFSTCAPLSWAHDT